MFCLCHECIHPQIIKWKYSQRGPNLLERIFVGLQGRLRSLMVEAKNTERTNIEWIEPQTFAETKPHKNKELKFKTEVCFYKTENPNDTITQTETVEDPGIDRLICHKIAIFILFLHFFHNQSCETNTLFSIFFFVSGFPEFSHFKKYSIIKYHRKGSFSFVKYLNKSHEYKNVNPTKHLARYLDELCPCAVIRRDSIWNLAFNWYTYMMKENRTLTSKPKFFSWNHANNMCLQTNQTLPDFFSRSEQEDFLNMIKQSKDVFPIEGVFIGIEHQSTSQVLFFCNACFNHGSFCLGFSFVSVRKIPSNIVNNYHWKLKDKDILITRFLATASLYPGLFIKVAQSTCVLPKLAKLSVLQRK